VPLKTKMTALGWHSYASRQSNTDQLRGQSLQCSWTSSRLPADLRQPDLSYSRFR